ARHLKCPIDSRYTGSARPLYRFSRYKGASGSREVRGTGGYSQPIRVGPGGRFGGRRLYLRGPGGGGGTLTDPSPTSKPVAAADCARVFIERSQRRRESARHPR